MPMALATHGGEVADVREESARLWTIWEVEDVTLLPKSIGVE
jgi:hypothetical protein